MRHFNGGQWNCSESLPRYKLLGKWFMKFILKAHVGERGDINFSWDKQ